jgi:hypothetical protein
MQLLLLTMSPEDEELINRRATALVCSVEATKARFRAAKAIDECAQRAYDESLLLESDIADSDWQAARDAAAKQDRLEEEYVASAPIRQAALLRLGWEMREARKHGIV